MTRKIWLSGLGAVGDNPRSSGALSLSVTRTEGKVCFYAKVVSHYTRVVGPAESQKSVLPKMWVVTYFPSTALYDIITESPLEEN